MVRNQMDMLDRGEAEPDLNTQLFLNKVDDAIAAETFRKVSLIEEIATNGEAIITFENGYTTEVHGDDTHFYPEYGVFFTEDDTPDDEEAESWYFAEHVVNVQRH